MEILTEMYPIRSLEVQTLKPFDFSYLSEIVYLMVDASSTFGLCIVSFSEGMGIGVQSPTDACSIDPLTGEIYLGEKKGMISFWPYKLEPHAFSPSMVVVDFRPSGSTALRLDLISGEPFPMIRLAILDPSMADRFPEGEPYMRMIHRNSEQLLQLINQLLDIRKLDSGYMKLLLEKSPLNLLLTRVLYSS